MNTIQDTAPEDSQVEINNYDEYLLAFFSKDSESARNIELSPQEIGVKMAEETLNRIRSILAESKTS